MKEIRMKIKDYAHTQEDFELKRVEEGLYKTQNLPQNLVPYYDFEEYISHDDSKKGIVGQVYDLVKNFMFHQKLNLIKNNAKDNPRILDYGCGTGDFLDYLKQKEYKVEGFEPTLKAKEIASKKGLKIHSEINLIDGEFDVITLFHVLEHVEDIDSLIKSLKQKLSKKGILIIAVPNHESKDAKIYKNYWAAWDVPRHIWHFSKESLIRKVKSYNFKLVSIKPLFFDAIYISMVSEKYKQGNSIKGILNGLYANLHALKTKSWSSHIFIFKKEI